jgi:hypothetical protein
MKAVQGLTLGLLLAAAGASAQDYGRQVPWDTEETGASGMLPRGNVQNARPLSIRTARPGCFLAAGFPVIRALIEPADSVERASVLFRPEGYSLWYQVPMRRSGEGFLAVLPKPRPSAQRVHYVVEVVAPGHPRARGQQLVAPVVEEPALCTGAPAETVESAAVGVRVPDGAPTVPPVPPGFVPVGAVSLEEGARKKGKLPLMIAGGFVTTLGVLFAAPPAGQTRDLPVAASEISFLDSVPPPDSRFSLRALPQLTVRMRVRTPRAVGPGNLRVVLFRSFSGTGVGVPCAVLVAPHGGFGAGGPQEVQISGPLQQAMVCQPADRMRLSLEENGTVVVSTGSPPAPPDYPARFFIDP